MAMFIHPKTLVPSLAAGALSGALFVAVAITGLGFFFLFLPTLPLLYAGLSRHPRIAGGGAVVASLGIAAIGGFSLGGMFMLLFGLPSWYFSRQAVLWREIPPDGEREWFPIGHILSDLTLYACAGVVLLVLYYSTQTAGLEAAFSDHIREAFSQTGKKFEPLVDAIATNLAFLIFSMTIWLWGIALYAHAWIAQYLATQKKLAIRPNMGVGCFIVPKSLLFLLVICALASLIGDGALKFLGKSLMVALLLPYFFSGAALLHHASKNWPNRGFLLFFVYAFIAAQLWPVLLLSGAGLLYQLKNLNKRLPPGGSSSSN